MEYSYEDLYREYFSKVYLYVLTLCHDELLAEEITQEAFFKALKRIDSFKGDCKIYTWLCQIAKNTMYDYFKKENRKESIGNEVDNLIFDLDLVIEFEKKELTMKAHTLLHKLEEPYKEVFTLRVFAELSFKEIGEIFSKSDGWARVVFYRSKKKLLEGLK